MKPVSIQLGEKRDVARKRGGVMPFWAMASGHTEIQELTLVLIAGEYIFTVDTSVGHVIKSTFHMVSLHVS